MIYWPWYFWYSYDIMRMQSSKDQVHTFLIELLKSNLQSNSCNLIQDVNLFCYKNWHQDQFRREENSSHPRLNSNGLNKSSSDEVFSETMFDRNVFISATNNSSSSIWLKGNSSERQFLQYQIGVWHNSLRSLGSRLMHFMWYIAQHREQLICLECRLTWRSHTGQLSMVKLEIDKCKHQVNSIADRLTSEIITHNTAK